MYDFESNEKPRILLAKEEILADEKEVHTIFLYVKQFKPEEISIKVSDEDLIISAKHKNQLDYHGLVTREFTRKYAIPEEFEPKSVSSVFGPQGILQIFILSKDLWKEYYGVKESVFRGYINLYLHNFGFTNATPKNDQKFIEELKKSCSLPSNTKVAFRQHLAELKGRIPKQ